MREQERLPDPTPRPNFCDDPEGGAEEGRVGDGERTRWDRSRRVPGCGGELGSRREWCRRLHVFAGGRPWALGLKDTKTGGGVDVDE